MMVGVLRRSRFARDIDWLPGEECADVIDGNLVDPRDALDAVEGYMRSEDDIWARYEIGVVHQQLKLGYPLWSLNWGLFPR